MSAASPPDAPAVPPTTMTPESGWAAASRTSDGASRLLAGESKPPASASRATSVVTSPAPSISGPVLASDGSFSGSNVLSSVHATGATASIPATPMRAIQARRRLPSWMLDVVMDRFNCSPPPA